MAISAGKGRIGLGQWARGVRVDTVLVRETSLRAGELVQACREVRAAVPAEARVLVAGGRVDVALAAALDGVHLGAGGGRLRGQDVRALWPGAYVSVSCHSLDEVRLARDEGASAVLFAPVFGKVVDGLEVVPAAGLGALAEACRVAGGMPVFALGGVTDANAAKCQRAGAAGIAAIRLFQVPGLLFPTG